MPINNPKEVLALVERAASDKISLPVRKILILAFLAGAYISMGGLFSIVIGYGFPSMAPAPGLQRLLSGLVFPLGLMLVVFAGAELFTGNNAVLIPGALGRRYGWRKVLLNWMLVYAGNFVGSLFFAWLTVFLRGVGANWLVCLAVWLGLSANDVAGRLLGLFFPIMCFVAIGYEHSVANMFFIPLGMMHGASVTVSDFLLANLVPATLGNIAGGAVFVGGIYWYINK